MAPSNDLHSNAVIRLWGATQVCSQRNQRSNKKTFDQPVPPPPQRRQADLDHVIKQMNQLVEGHAAIAEASMTVIDSHSGTAKLQDDLPL